MLPIGHRWTNKPGLTCIGDAAHLMVPFAGEGANLAMADGMRLAKGIIHAAEFGTLNSLNETVRIFEQEMFHQAMLRHQASYSNMQYMFFHKGAPRTVIEPWIMNSVRLNQRPLVARIIAVFVYTYFFFFKLLY